MSVMFPDPFYIRDLEKKIGRKLTEEEMEYATHGEYIIEFNRLSGRLEFFLVPMCSFPYDLMPEHIDAAKIEMSDYLKHTDNSPDEYTDAAYIDILRTVGVVIGKKTL